MTINGILPYKRRGGHERNKHRRPPTSQGSLVMRMLRLAGELHIQLKVDISFLQQDWTLKIFLVHSGKYLHRGLSS